MTNMAAVPGGRRFEGMVGIVTGGGSGIGAATAQRLAAEGARVAVFDVKGDTAAATCELFEGGLPLEVDVSDSLAVDRAVEDVRDAFGGLDFLAHIAGVDASQDIKTKLGEYYAAKSAPDAQKGFEGVVKLTDEEWRRVVGTNLDGTFFCTRAALRVMIPQRSGSIVTMSSSVGVQGTAGIAHYCSSKAGVRIFTQAVALEVAGFGIRVNSVAPGPTETPMFRRASPATLANVGAGMPLGRPGRADELASAVAYLLSDEAGFIVGETLNVNGGHVLL